MPKDQLLLELHKRQIIKKYKAAAQRHLRQRQRQRHKDSSLNNVDSARVPSFGSPMWEDQSPSPSPSPSGMAAHQGQRHQSHQLHRHKDKGEDEDENSPKSFGMHKKPKIEHQSPVELHKRQQMAKKKKAGYNQQRHSHSHSHKNPTLQRKAEEQKSDEDIMKFLADPCNPFKMNDSAILEKILNSQRIKNPFELHSSRVDHPTIDPTIHDPYVTTTTPFWLNNVSHKEKKLPFELRTQESWVTPSYAEYLNDREAVMRP
ncbi:Hypothetical predicted protein [Drosophila guanche]|uniref:Uncharacterized protein n=1 Tax=Drosophila guanche TaxID=7266 RepID=A0A3B0JVZ8_DROGU|nr:Hypothetical predicted protein [Drosophila guanche]